MESLDKGLLDTFWKLAEGTENERQAAATKIIRITNSKQKESKEICVELKYTIQRLIRGLSSDRKFARHGYSLALTKIFNQFQCINISDIFKVINKELQVPKGFTKKELSNVLLGQVLAYLTIIQTDKILQADADEIAVICKAINTIRLTKAPLGDVCTTGLVQLITKTPKYLVKASVWPLLESELSGGWSKCEANTLLLLITFVDLHKDIADKKFLSEHWESKRLIQEENLQKIGAVIARSSCINPLIHPVCEKVLVKAAKKPDLFQEFCQKVLNECLLVQNMQKKYLCLHLIHEALSYVTTEEQVKVLLSENLIALLMKQLQDKEQFIHTLSKKLVARFVSVIQEINDADIQVTMVLRLLQPPGSVFFDGVTKTSTVAGMIRNLNSDASEKFAILLFDTVRGGNTIGHKETIDFEVTLKWVVTTLTNMVSQVSKTSDGDWQLNILKFLFLHGYFKVTKEDKTITHCDKLLQKELDADILTLIQDNFFRALDRLTSAPGEKKSQKHSTSVLQKLVIYVQELLSSKSVKPHNEFSNKLLAHWLKLHSIIKELAEMGPNKDSSKCQAFELLFVHLAFQLYTEPKAVGDALEDLYICYEKAFSRTHQTVNSMDQGSGEEEPEWMEVVTEVLLSLLSHNSHLLRTVVKNVFSMLYPHLTSAALQIIVEVLKSSGNDEDDVVDFEDDTDNTGGTSTEEEAMGNGKEKADINQSDESDSDSDEDSDKEETVSEHVKQSLKAALGSAAQGSDSEQESDDDLSDSEMERLDDTLASAFKDLRKGSKKTNLEKRLQLKQYKMRCLDLIEVLTQGETPAGFLLELLYPLLDLLEETQKEKDMKELYNRALNVYHSLVKPSKTRKVLNLEGVENDSLPEVVQDLIERSTKVTGRDMIIEVANALVFVIQIVSGLHMDSSSSSLGAGPPSSAAAAKSTSAQNSECMKNVVNVWRKSIQDYCKRRDNLLSDVLFSVVFAKHPVVMWPLLTDLIALVQDESIRIFCRTKVCSLLTVLLRKNTVSVVGEQTWQESAQSIYQTFSQILDSVLASENIKPKFLEVVLQVLHNVLQLSFDGTIECEIDADLMVRKIQMAKEKNKSKDVKMICKKLNKLLMRRVKKTQSPNEQPSLKKRKVETNASTDNNKAHSKSKKKKLNEEERVDNMTEQSVKKKKKKLNAEERANNVPEHSDSDLLTSTVVSNLLLTKEAMHAKKLKKQKKDERLYEQNMEQFKFLKKMKRKEKDAKKKGEGSIGGMVGVGGGKGLENKNMKRKRKGKGKKDKVPNGGTENVKMNNVVEGKVVKKATKKRKVDGGGVAT